MNPGSHQAQQGNRVSPPLSHIEGFRVTPDVSQVFPFWAPPGIPLFQEMCVDVYLPHLGPGSPKPTHLWSSPYFSHESCLFLDGVSSEKNTARALYGAGCSAALRGYLSSSACEARTDGLQSALSGVRTESVPASLVGDNSPLKKLSRQETPNSVCEVC